MFALFGLPALLIAGVAVDVEPFYVLEFNVSGLQPHGFLHSYVGSSFLAFLVAAIVYPLRHVLNRIMTAFRLPQESPFKKILFTSFIGVYSHVFLDSFLYSEMNPLYPLQGNPFVSMLSAYGNYSVIYGFCGVTFFLGIILYVYKIIR